MLKFLIPALIVFAIVLFWEKISDFIKKKFNIAMNSLVMLMIILSVSIILALLYF